jgi:trk system potassium uptake protein TrkA
MRIVIAGAGTLGRRVANYTREQHDVLVIEQSRERAHAVEDELGVKVLVGDADEPAVLIEAGVDRADVFVASTGHDEDNLVASLLAKNEYKVRKVIAAVRNPRNRWLYNRSWGVDVAIDSAEIVTKLIEEEATLADVVTLLDLHEGEVTVSSMMINKDHWAAGKTMAQLGLPEGCVVAALLHDAKIVMPKPDTVVEAGDQLLIVAGPGAECTIREELA